MDQNEDLGLVPGEWSLESAFGISPVIGRVWALVGIVRRAGMRSPLF